MEEAVKDGSDVATIDGELRFVSREREWYFRHPEQVLIARTLEEVQPTLERAAMAARAGKYAAGFIAYEAAPAFDPALKTHPLDGEPLVWFGIFNKPEESLPRNPSANPFTIGDWSPGVSRDTYTAAIDKIRAYIAAGDTYQVNYTFPLTASFNGDALNWFRTLCQVQRSDHCAYIHTDETHVLSLSPELFFSLAHGVITARPMKGTAPRGLWHDDDEAARQGLADAEKEKAENIMIVDLLRNDLGRVCEPGSVDVSSLYDVEQYDTVWQMTSTITGRTDATVVDILRAVFPSGSVTGAPKVRTMEIIEELEAHPRSVYCGAIGWIGPDNTAEFNVAIRTVILNDGDGTARCHVGGGITWDSTADGEYSECLAKASFLSRKPVDFSLFESMRYLEGFDHLDAHMERLAASARYFGIPFHPENAKSEIEAHMAAWQIGALHPLKVRVILARNGQLTVEGCTAPKSTGLRLGFARDAVDPTNMFLYHKTTQRDLYETARCTRPDCDDVLLWNTRDEITETTFGNIVVRLDGEMLTPPVSCGLLPGVLRGVELARGTIREAVITKQDLERADRMWMINSVRRWVPIIWTDGP